jgi:hypothetical protein
VRNSVFHNHIKEFSDRLAALPASIDGISGYQAFYLSELIHNRNYYLRIYAQLLEITIGAELPSQKTSLLDIGSGNGLLGMFAKFCGVQKVVLLEPDVQFLKASEILSSHLDIRPDAFVCSSFENADLNFDVQFVVGTDMIEHVYDLDHFIQRLSEFDPVHFAFSTAANNENPLIRRRLKKIQYKDEMTGDGNNDSIEKGISSIPFFQIRKEIIRSHFSSLPEKQIDALASSTRGKNQADILLAINRFKESGLYPVPAGGSNTCDPLTGSWTERLLSFETYRTMFESHGFGVEFSTGFYNQWEGGMSGAVKKMLNNFISLGGFKISPYFVISGSKN